MPKCPHGVANIRECSPCAVGRVRKWRLDNPGRREKYNPSHNARYLRWVKNNPDRNKEIQKRSRLWRAFGLTLEDYFAMLESQHGLCAICQKPPKEGTFLAVDHNHITGKIRGLLCWRCNSSLGKFNDDYMLVRRAADYLESHDAK
jgi:hypothetical protein